MRPAAAHDDAPSTPPERDPDPSGTARAAERRTFIEQSAIALGQTWAEEWRRDLRREGRPAAGGWPGTLREARARVERTILIASRCRQMPPLTCVERELAARTTYASARNEWRRHIEPETP